MAALKSSFYITDGKAVTGFESKVEMIISRHKTQKFLKDCVPMRSSRPMKEYEWLRMLKEKTFEMAKQLWDHSTILSKNHNESETSPNQTYMDLPIWNSI